MAFLEYGTPQGLPTRVVQDAQAQIYAAMLRDVAGLTHLEIANELNLEIDLDRYKVDMKIPKVANLVRDGRKILDEALKDEGGWKARAKKMKIEGEHYNSLSREEQEIEAQAKNMGMTIEEARAFYYESPVFARAIAWRRPPG